MDTKSTFNEKVDKIIDFAKGTILYPLVFILQLARIGIPLYICYIIIKWIL